MFSPACQVVVKKLHVVLTSIFLTAFLLISGIVTAQETPPAVKDSLRTAPSADAVKPKEEVKKAWYENLSWRGYAQVRYNRILETNPSLKSPNDASIGDNGGFLIRRARLVLSGNVHERVFVYIQTDLAATPTGSAAIQFTQLRDLYADIALDSKKEYRFRVGQSKIPFGFENLQSSQNRLALDRADPLNSGVPNERDLGVFFYWTPEKIRKRFSDLANRTLKGSGDYGVFALGIYNGQTTNKTEANDNLHVVSRLTYPIEFKNGQIIEPGIQGYAGTYNLGLDLLSSAAVKGGNFDDKRAAASLILYPKPFGLQVEYNVGESPEFDPETKTVKVRSLKGGYAQASYNLKFKNQLIIPFVKAQRYEGGKKAELDARFTDMKEFEFGVEWQPISALELTTEYVISERNTKDSRNLDNQQKGNLLRLQLQFNY